MNDPAYCSDTTSPSMPTSLFATAQSSSQINLSWTASTDNVGVTGYRLERCTGSTCTTFTQIATPTGTSYSDTGLTANTTYRYRVRAVDAAGNLSSYSSIVNGTTQSGSVGGSYPNQPAGFLSVAEYNANVMPVAGPTNSSTACASEGVLDGCWWSSSGSTLLSVVSESTAPQSPTGTFQFKYPSGQQPGNGVGILQGWDTQYETSNTEYREVYESGWVRTVGSTFENQAVGTKMLGYWGVGESAEGKIPTQIYQVSIGNGATSPMSSWNIRFAQQGPDPISRSLSQTAGGAVWTAGVWHRYEIYMKLNDIDAANGLLKVWWNGTLVLDYGDVQWRNAANPDGFYGRRIAPIWGGLGGSNKTRDDFLQYDHIYISGVPMNAPTDTTAPPLRPFSPPRYNPPPKSTSLGLPQPTPNPVSPTTSFIGLYREYV
jgi:chitodextrinase